MMKLVQFAVTYGTDENSIVLPDSPENFSSMYFDSGSMTVQAAYRGALDLGELPGDTAPSWELDSDAWRMQNAYRTELTKKEFQFLFTPAEYRAIVNASDTDDILFQLWGAFNVADFIETTDPETVQGMGYILSLGLLTQERHDEILKGVSTWNG